MFTIIHQGRNRLIFPFFNRTIFAITFIMTINRLAVTILNNTDSMPVNLSPLFVSLFAFCFAITMGVFWEFYEYSFDGLLGLNMQKFALEDGTQLVGRLALADTMTDLFVDALGAGIISIIGGLSIKYKTRLIKMFHFKKM